MEPVKCEPKRRPAETLSRRGSEAANLSLAESKTMAELFSREEIRRQRELCDSYFKIENQLIAPMKMPPRTPEVKLEGWPG
jgi:hypothetical protein